MACWTSVGLSGAVSRDGGSARTEGYNRDADGDGDDDEQPDAISAGARQIANTASTLAVTQLCPFIWAYPRLRLKAPGQPTQKTVGASRSPYAAIMFTNRKTSTSSQRAGK